MLAPCSSSSLLHDAAHSVDNDGKGCSTAAPYNATMVRPNVCQGQAHDMSRAGPVHFWQGSKAYTCGKGVRG